MPNIYITDLETKEKYKADVILGSRSLAIGMPLQFIVKNAKTPILLRIQVRGWLGDVGGAKSLYIMDDRGKRFLLRTKP